MLIKGLIVLFLCEQTLQMPFSASKLDEHSLPKPTKFDEESPTEELAVLPHPLVITNPEEITDITAFLSIWEHRFSTQSEVPFTTINERPQEVPKIVLAVTPSKMTNLIPQDAPHPLYSSFYEKLTDDFILDSLSTQTIDFNNPKLKSLQGVTIKTMAGKDLVFKEDEITNKYTVNGIEIEKHQTITGDTIVIITSDFLFNYYNDIQTAFDELTKSPQPGEPGSSGTIEGNPGFRAESFDIVPLIPESLKDEQSGSVPSGLIRIWENRLSNLDEAQTPIVRAGEAVPKTILAVTSFKMINLIPQDAPHPLYSPNYEKLTDDFILDSLSTQTIDFTDPQLTSPQGVTVKTMSGKDLLFRKDQRKDAFTVNGIEIENRDQLPDGTNVIILSNFLFNNYDEVQKAFRELTQRPDAPSLVPSRLNERSFPSTDVDSEVPPAGTDSEVPPAGTDSEVPPAGTDSEVPPIDIDSYVTHTGVDSEVPPVGVDAEVASTGVDSEVPITSIDSEVSPADVDSKISPTDGDSEVPNTDVELGVPTAGGDSEIPPVGGDSEASPTDVDPEVPTSDSEIAIPDIPESFNASFEHDPFLNIWKFRLSKIQEPSSIRTDSRVPITILPVAPSIMSNLIPQDAGHPLYTDKYQTLANNFVLDSLSTDKIDFEDPKLTTPEGVVIKTMTGKDLVFKKDPNTDKITVNGINVDSHQLLSDQKTVVILNGYLFNYYEDTQKAFREMDHPNPFFRPTPIPPSPPSDSRAERQTETESAVSNFNVPQIPQDLEADDQDASEASQFVFLWKTRLSDIEQTPELRSTTKPKTILVVEPFKMVNLIPQDAPHPLFSPEHTDLTDRFILDAVSTEDIKFDNPELLTPQGLTIKSMNGRDLVFKKDENTGKIQVNGIEVVNHKILKGKTNVIIISDFLFNHYDDVQTAFEQLLKSNVGTSFHSAPLIPAVPKVLEGTDVGIDISGLLKVWEHRLTKSGSTLTGAENVPKTVVAVSSIKMINLTPQDAPNPLYSDEHEFLANNFILDSISSEPIDINDPSLLSTSGKTITTLSVQDLVFKKDEKTNKLTINGIEVENSKTFEDGTSVFVISDFLFDHFGKIRSAFDSLQKERTQQPGPPF